MEDTIQPETREGKVPVVVFADFVCPWSFIVQDSIDQLVRDYDVEPLLWKPHWLHPETPPEGKPIDRAAGNGRRKAVFEWLKELEPEKAERMRPPDKQQFSFLAFETDSHQGLQLSKWQVREVVLPRGPVIEDFGNLEVHGVQVPVGVDHAQGDRVTVSCFELVGQGGAYVHGPRGRIDGVLRARAALREHRVFCGHAPQHDTPRPGYLAERHPQGRQARDDAGIGQHFAHQMGHRDCIPDQRHTGGVTSGARDG